MFSIADFELQNGSTIIGITPLTLRGCADNWSYLVAFKNSGTVKDAASFGPAEIALDIDLVRGSIEVTAVKADWRTIVASAPVKIGRSSVLRVRNLAEVLGVVVRNADGNCACEFAINGIKITPTDAWNDMPFRGFGRKSALSDIARLSKSPIKTIFDVGANIGDMAKNFAEAFPSSNIHCFEPHPDVAEKAEQRLKAHNGISFHAEAVGATKGFLGLNSYSNSAINSVRPVVDDAQMDGEISLMETICVPVITIDDFAAEHGIETLDILKIDTQGFEMDVLKGARSLLASRSIRFIVSELLFVDLYDGQSNHFEITRLLELSGYRLFDYYDFVYSDDGQIKWGDGLFIATDK